MKLRNFREKLALALGEKKINQDVFGEMFGGYSTRKMSSYESGEVEIPGLLLYSIWQAGGSVDGIFGYLEISEDARITKALEALHGKAPALSRYPSPPPRRGNGESVSLL